MPSKKKISRLEQIDDGGSEGFVITNANGRCGLVVVRRGNEIYSYLNSCPHIGTPLEIQPGKFLDQNGEHILCSTHGALFQIDDGRCIAGPCVDKFLTPVAVEVIDGNLYIDTDALPTMWPPRIDPPKLPDDNTTT